jgi:predicted enzyme related to lactoylglutathione lyase
MFTGSSGRTGMDKAGDRFVWYELTAADMEGAKAFYTRVLGWGAADVSAPGHPYVLFTPETRRW